MYFNTNDFLNQHTYFIITWYSSFHPYSCSAVFDIYIMVNCMWENCKLKSGVHTFNNQHSSQKCSHCLYYSKTSNNGPSEKRTTHLSPIDFTIELRTSEKRTPLNSEQQTLISPRCTLANRGVGKTFWLGGTQYVINYFVVQNIYGTDWKLGGDTCPRCPPGSYAYGQYKITSEMDSEATHT